MVKKEPDVFMKEAETWLSNFTQMLLNAEKNAMVAKAGDFENLQRMIKNQNYFSCFIDSSRV